MRGFFTLGAFSFDINLGRKLLKTASIRRGGSHFGRSFLFLADLGTSRMAGWDRGQANSSDPHRGFRQEAAV